MQAAESRTYRFCGLVSCREEENCREAFGLQRKSALEALHKKDIEQRRPLIHSLNYCTFALGCSLVVPSILAMTRESISRKCLASLLYIGSSAWQWPHHGA